MSELQKKVTSERAKGNKYRLNKTPGNRKYNVNSNYFNNIDSEEKAYWFGFILADGGVVINNGYKFQLISIDRDHIEKLKNCIEYTGDVKTYKTGFHYLYISEKKFVINLCKKGIIPRKTQHVVFPEFIPDDLLNHFIRGYFDGDGCMYVSTETKHHKLYFNFSMLGTKSFLTTVSEVLKDKCNLKSASVKFVKNSNIWSYARSMNQADKICKYLYNDSSVYLERKYSKYIKYLTIREGNKACLSTRPATHV